MWMGIMTCEVWMDDHLRPQFTQCHSHSGHFFSMPFFSANSLPACYADRLEN